MAANANANLRVEHPLFDGNEPSEWTRSFQWTTEAHGLAEADAVRRAYLYIAEPLRKAIDFAQDINRDEHTRSWAGLRQLLRRLSPFADEDFQAEQALYAFKAGHNEDATALIARLQAIQRQLPDRLRGNHLHLAKVLLAGLWDPIMLTERQWAAVPIPPGAASSIVPLARRPNALLSMATFLNRTRNQMNTAAATIPGFVLDGDETEDDMRERATQAHYDQLADQPSLLAEDRYLLEHAMHVAREQGQARAARHRATVAAVAAHQVAAAVQARHPPRCYKCNRKGHYAADCQDSLSRASNVPREGGHRPRQADRARTPRRCWTCGAEGHLQRDCRAQAGATARAAGAPAAATNPAGQPTYQVATLDFGSDAQVTAVTGPAPSLLPRLLVAAQINSSPVALFADCGSPVSIVSEAAVHQLDSSAVIIDNAPQGLHAVNNTALPTLGTVTLTVEVPQHTADGEHRLACCKLPFVVTPGGQTTANPTLLMGRDALVAFDFAVRGHEVTVDDQGRRWQTMLLRDGPATTVTVAAAEAPGLYAVTLEPEPNTTVDAAFRLQLDGHSTTARLLVDESGAQMLLPAAARMGPGRLPQTVAAVEVIGPDLTPATVPYVTSAPDMSAERAHMDEFNWSECDAPPSIKRELQRALEDDDLQAAFVTADNPYGDACGFAPIHLPLRLGAQPCSISQYRLSMLGEKIARDQISEWHRCGIIRQLGIEEEDPIWRSPILVANVDASNRSKARVCLDTRSVNQQLLPVASPTPTVQQVLDQVADFGAFEYVSSIDLANGFMALHLDQESQAVTTFYFGGQLYQFVRLPFGLACASQLFSTKVLQVAEEVNLAFKGRAICICYVDDVIILGHTPEDELALLIAILQALARYGLRVKRAKCKFFRRRIEALGYQISADGVRPSAKLMAAIAAIAPPTTTTALRAFIGLANYFALHIPGYASLLAPLFALLQGAPAKGRPLKALTPPQLSAFNNTKAALMAGPVRAHPDFTAPFYLEADASYTGVGALLLQFNAQSQPHLVAAFSRSLTEAERRAHITVLELTAIVNGLQKFDCYLRGAPKIVVVTDHRALQYLLQVDKTSGRNARYALTLLSYGNIKVVYRPGSEMAAADALSRLPRLTSMPTGKELDMSDLLAASMGPAAHTVAAVVAGPVAVAPLLPEVEAAIRRAQPPPTVQPWRPRSWTQLSDADGRLPDGLDMTWPVPADVLQRSQAADPSMAAYRQQPGEHFGRVDGVMCQLDGARTARVVIPTNLKAIVLQQAHRAAAHGGAEKTLQALAERSYWDDMAADATSFVRACGVCAARNLHRPLIKQGELDGEAAYVNQQVALDLVGPILHDKQKRHVLVAVDLYSRYAYGALMQDKSAKTVARSFSQYLSTFGPPALVTSDQGTEFLGELKSLLKGLRVEQRQSAAYHPQGNGVVERFNRTLANGLAKMLQETANQDDWPELLHQVVGAYNDSPHPRLAGLAPNELMFGRRMLAPLVQVLEGDAARAAAGNVDALNHILWAHEAVTDRRAKWAARDNSLLWEHHPDFKVDDPVRIHREWLAGETPKKLHNAWETRGNIAAKIDDYTYQVYVTHGRSAGKKIIVSIYRLKADASIAAST